MIREKDSGVDEEKKDGERRRKQEGRDIARARRRATSRKWATTDIGSHARRWRRK